MLSKDRLRFINSLQFMSASLDKLVANLPSDAFVHLDRHTTHTELLKRKGVYPYDYVDGPARLEETRLPPQSGSARPASPMSTTPTTKSYGRRSICPLSPTTSTCTSSRTSFCSPTYLSSSASPAWPLTV